jgi:hypothetical protein
MNSMLTLVKTKNRMTHVQFVKKLDDYFKMVSEALKNPLDIRWIDKGSNLVGLFAAYNHVYQINCVDKGYNIWKYDFYLYDQGKNEFSPELTGYEKDKYRVLPTVELGVNYLYKLKSPDAIVFGAVDQSRGRKGLYDSFCKKFSKEVGYEYSTNVSEGKQIFVLFKREIDREVLISKVMEIVQDK